MKILIAVLCLIAASCVSGSTKEPEVSRQPVPAQNSDDDSDLQELKAENERMARLADKLAEYNSALDTVSDSVQRTFGK